MRGLSLVAASGGHSSSRCAGLSLSRPLLLRSTGSRGTGSVVVAHGPSCSEACGILPDQGSNPRPLHWQADSQPLRHQGSPKSQLFPAKLPLLCNDRQWNPMWHLTVLYWDVSLCWGFSRCFMKKHLPYLALCEPSPEKQPFPYEDSSAFRGDIGFVCSRHWFCLLPHSPWSDHQGNCCCCCTGLSPICLCHGGQKPH